MEAYLLGLETLAAHGKSLAQVSSVASFFLSRIDVLIDPLLEKLKLEYGTAAWNLAGIQGQVAIASAKVAYVVYKEIFGGERYLKLAQMGARTQRLLWASTGTKNPEYSDVKYIEPLIGDQTINTIPPETLNAYRDHGKPSSQLEIGVREAYHVLDGLHQAGLDLVALTQELEDEGVMKFSKAFEQLMAALHEKHVASSQELVNP